MMTILHVIESLEFGGAEKVVVQLANRFSSECKVIICMTKRKGELCKLVDPSVQLICLEGSEGNDYSVITKLTAFINENNINIVHVHNWSVYLEGVLSAKRAGIKNIIHTIHGPYMAYGSDVKSKIKKYARHLLERYLSRYVKAFVPVSYSIKNYAVEEIKIPENKLHVIHNGVKGLNISIRKYNSSKTQLQLVMVGRVASIKNHKLMLDAMKELVKDIDVFLTIVGDGPDLQKIKAYSDASNLTNYVSFLGFRDDIEFVLSDKDIFVLTSDYEGISIALLESMSMGLPTIATCVGGIPETVVDNKTGILIGPGNTAELIAAIKRLSGDSELRSRMGKAAYDYFMKEFNEDNVIKQYKQLYKT